MNTHLAIRSRRGKTLLEVAVIISLTSVVLSLASVTLVTLFRVERQTTAGLAHERSLARLASQWRADAHLAVAVKTGDGCEMRLNDGRSVFYAFSNPRITREVRLADRVEHRDAFLLAGRAEARFSTTMVGHRETLQLSIAPTESTENSYLTPVRPVTLSATLNLHEQVASKEDAR